MGYEALTEQELLRRKKLLTERVSRHPDKSFQRNNPDSKIWTCYAMGSREGKQLYQSFSDEELLAYLRSLAEELYHAPAQKEVFWVLRDYIKCRFKKWPYALRAAGLSSSAGSGGKTMDRLAAEKAELTDMLFQVREKAVELGRLPHPKDLPEVCEKIKRYYSRWGQVLEAAGIEGDILEKDILYKIDDLEPEYVEMLEEIREQAYRRGRSPIHGETDLEVKRALIKRCGSWRNVLYQIGLTPVIRRKPFNSTYIDYRRGGNRNSHSNSLYDCFYTVLNLGDWEKAALAYVKGLYQSTGRIPLKEDVSDEFRKRLQSACGTWANALFQIGIVPADYYEALKKSRRGGSSKLPVKQGNKVSLSELPAGGSFLYKCFLFRHDKRMKRCYSFVKKERSFIMGKKMENNVYGYVRVSSKDQNEDRQLIALGEYKIPEKNIYIDKQSGCDFDRAEYQRLLRRIKEGDLLIVKSIDRLGRNYREIMEQWRYISHTKGADIKVIDMPLLDTTRCKDLLGTFISDLVLQVLSFVAENERENIRQRQKEGIAAAKARGVQFGRPVKTFDVPIEEVITAVDQGSMSLDEALQLLDVSRSTYYNKRKQHVEGI